MRTRGFRIRIFSRIHNTYRRDNIRILTCNQHETPRQSTVRQIKTKPPYILSGTSLDADRLSCTMDCPLLSNEQSRFPAVLRSHTILVTVRERIPSSAGKPRKLPAGVFHATSSNTGIPDRKCCAFRRISLWLFRELQKRKESAHRCTSLPLFHRPTGNIWRKTSSREFCSTPGASPCRDAPSFLRGKGLRVLLLSEYPSLRCPFNNLPMPPLPTPQSCAYRNRS